MTRPEISKEFRDQFFHDPHWQDYLGEEMLDNQPPWLVPDEWKDYRDEWMAPEIRRKILDFHADFLETLFDEDGNTTLYRAMDSRGFKEEGRPLPKKGQIVDIGKHWTYSGDADLSDAQISSGSRFDIVFEGKIPFSKVDWWDTLADHLYRHWHEKQIFVEGPVKITDVMSMGEFRREAKKIDFDKWLKKAITWSKIRRPG